MLDFRGIQRVRKAIDLDRIVASVGDVEIRSSVIDDSPARSGARVWYSPNKGKVTSGIIGVHGYLADRRDIYVQNRKKRMRAHAERLVAPAQAGEDRVRQRLRKILIKRSVRIEAERLQESAEKV